MVKDYIYFNDRIIAPGDAGLPLNDLVILRGYGIFDYLRSFRYQPLFIEDYVARFFRFRLHLCDCQCPWIRTN